MTAQIPENLIYEGQQVPMCTHPLSDYFALGGKHLKSEMNCTALVRRYIGRWEIFDGRLYLIALHGKLEDGKEASLATLFPDYPDRVFAHWYSGTLRIPQGKRLNYVHQGYQSVFERDLYLEIERGIVRCSRIQHNGDGANDGKATRWQP